MSNYYEQCKCGCYTDHAPCYNCLESQFQQAQADNKHLQELIYEQGLKVKEYENNPTVQRNERLEAENAALREDNAAMVNKFRQIHRHIHPHNVPWYFPEIDHICDSVREISHPGDSLLKELEALRVVRDAAEELKFWNTGFGHSETHTELVCKLQDALAAVKGSD